MTPDGQVITDLAALGRLRSRPFPEAAEQVEAPCIPESKGEGRIGGGQIAT